jgi:tetratricopeptide (TPR) repeat protein
MANLQRQKGDLRAAVGTLEKALKQQDDMPQLYAFYATLLDEQKNYKQALHMLNVAVEKFPENTQLRFFYGTMHDRLGDTTETIVQMKKVLDIDRDHVQALNYLAYTLAEVGKDLDEAYGFAERALKLQPNDGYILDTIGWIHFKRGEIEQAVKYLEAAYAANSDEAIIAEHLGDAYLRFQMWQKAQKMYLRAAKLEVDHSKTVKIQEKLANVERQIEQPSSRSPASVSPIKAQ